MVNRPKSIGTAAETAPTSPKPHTPTDLTVSKDAGTTLDKEVANAGLRADLTKLADDLDARGSHGAARYVRSEIRALLAAHPAQVVSDTRREDVAQALLTHRYRDHDIQVRWHALPESHRAAYMAQADAVLAVLPAPPVVDEATVLERAADDMEAVIALGDAAESTAVPAGTKGVGSAIGARDALYEDPVTWLRIRAAITTALSQEDA